MTPNERANLKFLLNASEDIIRDWYASVDAADHEYAMEIMAAYSAELRERDIEFQIEKLVEESDWRESAELLSKFVGHMPGETA